MENMDFWQFSTVNSHLAFITLGLFSWCPFCLFFILCLSRLCSVPQEASFRGSITQTALPWGEDGRKERTGYLFSPPTPAPRPLPAGRGAVRAPVLLSSSDTSVTGSSSFRCSSHRDLVSLSLTLMPSSQVAVVASHCLLVPARFTFLPLNAARTPVRSSLSEFSISKALVCMLSISWWNPDPYREFWKTRLE